MCVRSRNHSCTQCTLLFLLFISLIVFTVSIALHIGLYFTTAPEAKSGDLIAQSAGEGQDNDVEVFNQAGSASWYSSDFVLKSNCSWVQTQIHTGKLFKICEKVDTDDAKLECFRTTVLYTGLASILPACLVLLSIISVCRLLLCPVLTLGLVWLLLGVGLLVLCCCYENSVLWNEALSVDGTLSPLAYQLLALVALYALLALLHILLFAFVLCERRRAASSKGLKHSTSDDENGLDIDDPRAPLYGYSSRPGTDFDERVKDFKYIDDDMSYILRK